MNLRDELNAFFYSTTLCDLRLMNQKFVDQTLTYNSLLYLELIHFMGGTCTVSKLAELLHVSKPAVTQKVNDLIRQGFVLKTPDPKDHRQNFLSINEAAAPQFRIYRRQDDQCVKELTNRFSQEEIQNFCKMLHILTQVHLETNRIDQE